MDSTKTEYPAIQTKWPPGLPQGHGWRVTSMPCRLNRAWKMSRSFSGTAALHSTIFEAGANNAARGNLDALRCAIEMSVTNYATILQSLQDYRGQGIHIQSLC